MPKPPLSYEALFAALTVVGAAACSKAAPSSAVKAEPAPVAVSSDAPASGAAAAPAPVVATEKADTLAAAPSAKPVGATEPKKPMPRSMNKATPKGPKGNAACGAGTCSDEMKK